ncbi:MAG: S41 family peptidase [Vicinamibacterales bacterium]
MWAGDGRSLFFVSDAGGPENLWALPVTDSGAGAPRRVTAFTSGRLLWPSATRDAGTIAFERDFGVWTLDTATGRASAVPIVRRGAASSPVPERVRRTSQFRDLALSPDGKKVAFVVRGDVFAASAKDGGEAARVTDTAAIESQPVWAPDSRRLAFVAAHDEGQQIRLHDFGSGETVSLTPGDAVDLSPVFSPDGKTLAFLRDRRELRVIDLASHAETRLATGTFADTIDSPRPAWSPDGRWIATFFIGDKGFTNVELVPAGGGVARPISYLANVFTNRLAWSPDGTAVFFDTGQRTESGQLARVDLTLRTPKFREDLFRDLFTAPTQNPPPATPATPATKPAEPPAPTATTGEKPGAPAAGAAKTSEPVEPVFENIHERLSLLPLGLDVGEVVVSPDGKTAVVVAQAAGQANLYAWSLDELATSRPVARQLTTTAGGKADPQFSPDGKEVYYLDAGRIQIASVERRESRPLAVTAELTEDFARDRLPLFTQAWTLMRDNFFDPGFNGVDWTASRAHYAPYAAAAATADELRRIISLMIGDLDASHLGVSGGSTPAAIGHLGLDFDRAAREASGRLQVTGVVPLGPAALTREIVPGDVLAAVDGRPIGPADNLDERLDGTIDKRVVLTFAARTGDGTRDVVVRPVSASTEKNLRYRWWVETNREAVRKKSGGRLGYVHMINMSAAAMDQLVIDLDTRNHAADGVVVDLRNNNGGFVNAYALDVFARRPYLRMSTRVIPESPARTILGQRALERPTVLVTNRHSLSDAEDFTEGYRALKLGSVVGEPTAGWIIYTWNVSLFDGTTFRLPRMRIRGADGGDMEHHPRPVDVEAQNALGESLVGADSQLDAAIKTLVAQLGRAEAPAPARPARSGGSR